MLAQLALNSATPSSASTMRSSVLTPFHGCSSGFLKKQATGHETGRRSAGTQLQAVHAGRPQLAARTDGTAARQRDLWPTKITDSIHQSGKECATPATCCVHRGTHVPSLRYWRQLMDACPAMAEATPTPSRPPIGPATGVAHDTRSAMPATCMFPQHNIECAPSLTRRPHIVEGAAVHEIELTAS